MGNRYFLKERPMRSRLILGLLFCCLCAVAMAAEETAPIAAEKPSLFKGHPAESIWTLIWFFLLLAVLWKLAWKPLLAGLKARQQHIEKQITDAEDTKKKANGLLDEYRSKLADAERQGRNIIDQRTREAEKQAKDIQSQNRLEIEQMKLRLQQELENERNQTKEELWAQAGQIVQKLGAEIFGKVLDDADNQTLIEQAVRHLKEAEESRQNQDGQTPE